MRYDWLDDFKGVKVVFTPESFDYGYWAFIDKEGNLVLMPEKKKKNPFERVGEGEDFYILDCYGEIQKAKEGFLCSGPSLHEVANYCTDAELLRRRALYEKLERCLWRFSIENGGSGDYYPILNRVTGRWSVVCAEIQRFGPSFKTREACARAIEEVVKPMLDGVDEEIFVWEGV